MNTQRLEQVIRVLESIPPERFDIEVWVDPRLTCGTATCALGWCAQDPWHRAEGLPCNDELTWGLVRDYFGLGSFSVTFWLFDGGSYSESWQPRTLMHLGLPPGELDDLHDIGPKDVISRIRWLITHGDPSSPEPTA